MEPEKKMTWAERCQVSDGQMFLVPEKFHDRVKEWQKYKQEFDVQLEQMARLEVENSIRMQNILFELRSHFADQGVPGVFTKDIGFEENALAENEYVVNIIKPVGMPR